MKIKTTTTINTVIEENRQEIRAGGPLKERLASEAMSDLLNVVVETDVTVVRQELILTKICKKRTFRDRFT